MCVQMAACTLMAGAGLENNEGTQQQCLSLSALNSVCTYSVQISSKTTAACHKRRCECMHMGETQTVLTMAYLVAKDGIQYTTIPVGLNVTVTLLAPVP